MNRYAISPIAPLGRKGTDGGGVVYRNSWDLDIPYDGFYGLKGTVDNFGRILVDGKEILGVGRRGVTQSDRLDSFKTENPPTKKFFLTKGKHTIEVEVENQKTETSELVDKKIFSTKDWLFPPKVQTTSVNAATTTEEWVKVDDVFIPPTEQIRDRGQVLKTIPKDASFHQANEGTYYKGKKIRESGDWNNTDPHKNYIEWDSNTRLTLGTYRGFRFAIAVWNKKVTTGNQATTTTTTSTAIINQSPTAAGVVYEGPTPIANYKSDFISPVFQDVNAKPNEEIQGKTWIFRWSNVDFPETGQYTLEAEADDNLIIKIDGVKVGESKVFEGRRKINFNITRGKRTVELELSNIRIPDTGFQQNPVVAFAQITKKVNQATGISKPWTENPMGISAILIPPPCPKKIRGKGVVTDVIVDDPGNGFPRPGTGGYPVSLRLKNVVVEDTGINYSCGIDQIQIIPNNGAVLDYECDTFGRIINVKVLNPGLGFTRYPEITIPSDTGINATFRPQFEVVRDPIAPPEKLIQVTDLVGLKQTGYVDGRAYYGSVFYKDGVRYAGFYETPGDLVQVYDTLQESIDAQVTTPPSAIQRQGTDVTSNDPRLNIPGTPENLI